MEHTLYVIGQEIGELQQRVGRLEALAELGKHYGKRLGILAVLWISALAGLVSAQQIGDYTASIIRQLTGL
jgi:hypothetical protein